MTCCSVKPRFVGYRLSLSLSRAFTAAIVCLGPILSASIVAAAEDAEMPAGLSYSTPQRLAVLENREISESSGLAVSRRDPNRFWTHNDSGDSARLFCFDMEGKHKGTCRIKKAKSTDWEDMCSFTEEGKAKLLVADIGDNTRRRQTCYLYVIKEPKDPGKDTKKFRKISVRYADGPRDCEAIGIDIVSRKLIFVTKILGLVAHIYEGDFPREGEGNQITLKRIGSSRLPMVTAMDISPDGRRAIVLTLGQAFEFVRDEGETWTDAFGRKPRKVHMPPRKQGEAICYGANGRDLYLTSELRPAPFYVVKAKGTPSEDGLTTSKSN